MSTDTTNDTRAPAMDRGTPLVHAVNVTKAFHGNQVLKGIDMDVHPGEVVCLLGPSGSGKTTTLRVIAGFETADAGQRPASGRHGDGDDNLARARRIVDADLHGVEMRTHIGGVLVA